MRNGLCTALLLALPAMAVAQEPASVEQVDQIFRTWANQQSAGCAVGISKAGQPLLQRAYGMANLEHDIPNTASTIFEAGSVSKQFTAAAVILLALDGKLSLDDDVRKYVPEVPDYGAPIRIRHLINHTSGLRDWGSVAAIAGTPRGSRAHTHAHVLDIVSRQRALNFPPGQEYSYSNTGYNLLAIIVDRVSRTPFADFTRKRLFEPLGMKNTQWRDDYTRVVKSRATAYSPRGSAFVQDMPFENVHGNGGLLTTVGDLLIWTENLQTGNVGGQAFLAAMHTQGVLTNGRQISYAAGLNIGEYNGLREVSHTGSTGGYRAYLARYPEQQLAFAVLCNAANANPGSIGTQLAAAYLGAPRPRPESAVKAVAVPAEEVAKRAGVFHNPRTGEPLRLTFSDGVLRAERTELIPLSATEFHARAPERHLVFTAARPGQPERLTLTTPAGDTTVYERAAAARTAPAQLQEYTGDYYSADAETTFSVIVENGTLFIKRRPDASMGLVPLYADVFQGGVGLVRFIRDPRGQVRELSLRQPRVYDLRFTRTQATRR